VGGSVSGIGIGIGEGDGGHGEEKKDPPPPIPAPCRRIGLAADAPAMLRRGRSSRCHAAGRHHTRRYSEIHRHPFEDGPCEPRLISHTSREDPVMHGCGRKTVDTPKMDEARRHEADEDPRRRFTTETRRTHREFQRSEFGVQSSKFKVQSSEFGFGRRKGTGTKGRSGVGGRGRRDPTNPAFHWEREVPILQAEPGWGRGAIRTELRATEAD